MINLPQRLTDYINRDSRTFRARVVTPTVTIEQEIMGFQLCSNFVADNISFGYACSDSLEIQLCDVDYQFQGAEFELLVGFSIDRQMEYVSFGLFRTQKAQKTGRITKILAYDRMIDTARVPFSTELSFPVSAKSLVKEICDKSKIPFRDTLNENFLIEKNVFNKCTNREVLSYIAAYFGTNAVINREGELEFKWFKDTRFVTNENRISEPVMREFEYDLGYIKCNNGGDKLLEVGTGGNGFTFDCPLMTQERLDYLFKRQTPFRYNPVDFDLILGDPRLEVGDVITVDYCGDLLRVPIMSLTYDFDGGLFSNIVSFGKTDEEQVGVSITRKFSDIRNDVTSLNDITKATITLNDVITNSLGLYTTKVTIADGSSKSYMHDRPKLEDSFTIYTMNEGGFAWTKSGWNNGRPVWQYGVDKDGNAVLNALVANTLTALHITGSVIEGTVIKGGRVEALNGTSYFDLDNGKLYSTNAELSGKFEVNPTANTSLKLRHGAKAVQYINTLWTLSGMEGGWGSVLNLDEATSASLDYEKDGKMKGTLCFAKSNIPEYESLDTMMIVGCSAMMLEFGLAGNSRSITSLTAPNANGEITTYIDGEEKSKYTDKGMTISNEITTDDVTFNSVEEIKTNITEAKGGAIDIIKKAKVYNYDLKRDKAPKKRSKSAGKRFGFVIGREVPEEMLAEGEESISIYNTVALLTKAVQEQAKTAEMQSKRIEELTNALKNMQEKSTP